MRPANAKEHETAIAAAMSRVWTKWRIQINMPSSMDERLAGLRRTIPVFSKQSADASRDGIVAVFLLSMHAMMTLFEFLPDRDEAGDFVRNWSDKRSEWLGQVTVDTSATRLEEKLRDLSRRRRNGEKKSVLDDEWDETLDSVFSGSRAQGVGITEVTESNVAGENAYSEWYRVGRGTKLVATWVHSGIFTKTHPCHKWCLPLIGHEKELWRIIHPHNPELWDGPPAHPNCDCQIEWSLPGGRSWKNTSRVYT